MKIRNPYLLLYSVVIFLLFIVSMYHWIGWAGRQKFIYAICAAALVFLMTRPEIRVRFTRKNIVSCILFYLSFLIIELGWRGEITHVLITQLVFVLIPVAGIICISDMQKRVVFRNVLKFFSWMLVPALVLYVLNLAVDLPSLGVSRLSTDHESLVAGYGFADNYFFMVKSHFTESIPRFQGPFLEPGHLGMMCSFLALVDGHKYRKASTWVLLLSMALSFSLAGYVLWVVGFLICQFREHKLKPSILIPAAIVFSGFVFFGLKFNGGDNIINKAIISRLQFDDDKGFSGNNRSSINVALLFAQMHKNPGTILLGLSQSDLSSIQDEPNNGYLYFMVRFGLVGLLIGFSSYAFMAISSKRKKWALGVLLFVFLMFWQRTYLFWFSWMICFNYALAFEDLRVAVTPVKKVGSKCSARSSRRRRRIKIKF